MTVEVLISCMHLNSVDEVMELVKRTNIQGACTVVSQCEKDAVVKIGDIQIIFTTERGLSRSRNMAIRNATGDICLVCDDDEILYDNYEKIIIDGYSELSDGDIIAFKVISQANCHKPRAKQELKLKGILKTSSVEISFKRQQIIDNNIHFDVEMGSGTGHGAGEENKFLMDCRRAGLKLYCHTNIIGQLLPNEHTNWNREYNKEYFYYHGWAARRILGAFLSSAYIIYYVGVKHQMYKGKISVWNAFLAEFSGWFHAK